MKHLAARHPGARTRPPTATATSCTACGQAGGGGQPAAGPANSLGPATARRWAPCWRACTWLGASFGATSPTCAACPWWNDTVPGGAALPRCGSGSAAILAYQNHVAAGSSAYAALPRGSGHLRPVPATTCCSHPRPPAAQPPLRFLRFLLAGVDTWAFDPAWPERLVRRPEGTGSADEERQRCLPAGLRRPAEPAGRRAPPAAGHARRRSLRFWISRLWTCTAARSRMLKPHDPTHFERRACATHACRAGLSSCPQASRHSPHRPPGPHRMNSNLFRHAPASKWVKQAPSVLQPLALSGLFFMFMAVMSWPHGAGGGQCARAGFAAGCHRWV